MNQRQIALRAQKAVQGFAQHEHKRKLKTLCMKTPGLMCQSGLAQTLTFLRSREPGVGYATEYLDAIIQITDFRQGRRSAAELHEHALKIGVVEYIALTAEVQRAMEWLRRFAQIEMKDIEEQEDDP